MPGVIPFIPLLLGAAGMVDSNIQNKAALKNNQNQQTAATDAAKQAGATAQSNYGAYSAANPGPVAGASVTGPGAQKTAQNAVVAKILQAAQAQTPKPMATPTPPPPVAPANPGLIGQLLA